MKQEIKKMKSQLKKYDNFVYPSIVIVAGIFILSIFTPIIIWLFNLSNDIEKTRDYFLIPIVICPIAFLVLLTSQNFFEDLIAKKKKEKKVKQLPLVLNVILASFLIYTMFLLQGARFQKINEIEKEIENSLLQDYEITTINGLYFFAFILIVTIIYRLILDISFQIFFEKKLCS